MDRETRQSASVAYDQCSIRNYTENDFLDVSELWTEVICEFATPENIAEFKQYSQKAIEDELEHVAEQYTHSGGNAFWVCEIDKIICGTVGIQRKNLHVAELRRMYLHKKNRGSGIAHTMLAHAEEAAKTLRYRDIALVTAEIQLAAIRFYEKNGFVRSESKTAQTMSEKTVGLNLTRYQYEKSLNDVGVSRK